MNPISGSAKEQLRYNNTTSILVAVHTWRIVGIAFLWGVSQGILPPAFGIPAGVGDILIGVTAIPFAYFLRKGYSWSRYALVVWSVLGIADLVNAISLGLITAPEFPGSTMTTIPWVIIPTMGVPLALILHGITLYRLRSTGFPSST
ncbi:MAG: hypothetical protein GEU26_08835 [Nitrososphaeraceae archaeon]|nr:hypothetical protein [Nitrososphaeraceae archaeon]